MVSSNLNERVAALETKVGLHKEVGDGDYQELSRQVKEMNDKLDSLLVLKHKGAGAFLAASALFGTGIISFFYSALDWFRGVS